MCTEMKADPPESELKKYIDNSINRYFEFVKDLSDTAINSVKLYRHIRSGKLMILRKSNYRNDDVYRMLKDAEKSCFLPEIYDVASEDDALYVLEEYITGDSLSSLLDKGEQFTAESVKQYGCDICEALKVLHESNIIHRDIKPENIIIKENGCACLVDLSIAKIMTQSKKNDTMNLGSAGYAAPEQYGILQSSPATDIYSLGILLNELSLGCHPTQKIPSGRLGKIIRKCTTLQISKRYQSVSQIQSALKKYDFRVVNRK